ncbi:MAG: transglycosylase domain-containing protein [Devosia sp.]
MIKDSYGAGERLAVVEGVFVRAILKLFGVLIVTLVSIPLILTVAYTVTDPWSVPMIRRTGAGEPIRHRWVPLNEISPTLVQGVVMAEDARFCLHYGVDLGQLRIVVEEALDGGHPRGASTITMQTVKNLYLWPERSYLRKAIEIPLAVWMDLILSKDRILEIYLNIAQWGGNDFGVEAAAQRNFGVSAAKLTERQALALATMLPAPSRRNPRNPGARQRRVMAHVARELDRAPWVFTCLPQSLRP